MADDDDKSSAPSARASRGRRRGPTIDLQATEVAADPAAQPGPLDATPASESPPPQTPKPPPPETPGPHAAAAEETPTPPPPPSRRGAAPLWSMLGGAIGGAILALIIVFLVWGAPVRRDELQQQGAQLATLDTSVRELGSTVRELAARKPPPSADPQAVAALAERVAKVEAAVSAPQAAAPDAALADRLAVVEQRLEALVDELTALRSRADAAAARAEQAQAAEAQDTAAERQDLATLNQRLAALEKTTQSVQLDVARLWSNITEQRSERADQSAVRLALIAEMLKAAVARGDRFRTELEAAKALAPDKAALAPLEAFADSGVPTEAALAQQLRALLPAMRRAVAPKVGGDAGFLERLQASAGRLVRIEPIGEQPGSDPDAILTRIESKVGRGDIAGALTEMMALPPNVRAPAEEWIKRAQMRAAAVEASQRFAAAHVGALAGRPD